MILVLDLGTIGDSSYETNAVKRIAEDHPALKIVIAHLAQPTLAAESDPSLWRCWEEQIDLGLLPNVWFDTAALPIYVSPEGYPYPTAGKYLAAAIDRISPAKIMWGTDIPGLLAYATYPQLLEWVRLGLSHLPEIDRELILGLNAVDVFGL